MKKKRRGYNYNKDYGSNRNLSRAVKKLYNMFKFKKKIRHKRNKLFVFYNNKRNFYPAIHKIGSIEIPLDSILDSIGDYDEEESDN